MNLKNLLAQEEAFGYKMGLLNFQVHPTVFHFIDKYKIYIKFIGEGTWGCLSNEIR